MGYDVFISYSSQHNKKEADDICAVLESSNIKCWYAPRDILAGKSYPGSIIYALNECSVMVLIYSSWSNQSPHIATEVERAFSRQLTIIPFRVENVKPSPDLEYCISAPQWLDAFPESKYNPALQTLVSSVHSTLSKSKKTWKVDEPELSPQEQKLFKRIKAALEDDVITDKEREQIELSAKGLEVSKDRLAVLMERAKQEEAAPELAPNELKYIALVKEEYVGQGKALDDSRSALEVLAEDLDIEPARAKVLVEECILGQASQAATTSADKIVTAPQPQPAEASPITASDISSIGLLEYFQAKSPLFIEDVLYKRYESALKEIEAAFDYYQNWDDSSVVLRVLLGKSKFNIVFRMLKSENTYAVWFDDVHYGKDVSIEWLDKYCPGETAKKNVINRRNIYGYVKLWKKEILSGAMQESNVKVFDDYCQFILKTLDLFIPKIKEGRSSLSLKIDFINRTVQALSEVFPAAEGWRCFEDATSLAQNTCIAYYKEAWSKEGYSRGLLSFSLESAQAGFTNFCIGIVKANCDDLIEPPKEEQLRQQVADTLQGYNHRTTKWWPYYSFAKDEYRYIDEIINNQDMFIVYVRETFLSLKQNVTPLIDNIIDNGSIGNPAVALIDDTIKALSVAFPDGDGWQTWQDASTLEKGGGISLYKTGWKNENVDRGEKSLLSIRMECYKKGLNDIFIGIAKGTPRLQIAKEKEKVLISKTKEIVGNVKDDEPDWWVCWLNLEEPYLNIGDNIDKRNEFIPYITDMLKKMATSASIIDSIIAEGHYSISQ